MGLIQAKPIVPHILFSRKRPLESSRDYRYMYVFITQKQTQTVPGTPDYGLSHLTGVNSIFSQMDWDRSVIEDILGSSTGISENNIMSYLGLVEQKTNELLTIQAFLNSKVTCRPVLLCLLF